jgi:hypothetical protein
MLVNVVDVNETYNYNIHKEDSIFIKEVHTVYAYNPLEYTYCCELTPSHRLIYLYDYIIYRGESEATEDVRNDLDEKYCMQGGEDIYMHVSRVKNLTTKECGEFDDMEAAREYLCANCPF